ncbi:hypothetical protein ACCO45_012837 [Purpureocillium lilacinum]|uniref:Uncharacterized protein n=1 Tax=Purpureocillium lilacinum TaxID=33203 RepID=A0ACC4D9A5_PURLI
MATTHGSSTTSSPPWYAAYPPPRHLQPGYVTREELLSMLKDGENVTANDFVLVDLRRADHEVSLLGGTWCLTAPSSPRAMPYCLNPPLCYCLARLTLTLAATLGGTIRGSLNLPAQSLYPTIPTLYCLFKAAGVRKVIWYCSSSRGRGTRAAGWFQDHIVDCGGGDSIESLILYEGVKGWALGGSQFVEWMEELTWTTPGQFKTPDSSAQNRERQRRSRARRRELIDDLSRQLDEYKRRDAQATQEMQRAARAVSDENQRLRALLRLRGVSPSEVRRYLASFPSSASSSINSALPTATRVSSSSLPTRSTSTIAKMSPTAPATAPEPGLPKPALSPSGGRRSLDVARPQRQADGDEFCQRPGYDGTQYLEQVERSIDSVLPPMSDCFYPPGPPTEDTDGSRAEMLETSCDAAAAILLELHGQATDLGRTRAALGCNGGSSCFVKNTTLFRLMDDMDG